MIPYERQQKILGLLKEAELVKFNEIQQTFSKCICINTSP